MNILAEIRSRFDLALRPFVDDPAPFTAMVKPAQDPRFGDFQANCAMPLAKQVGRNPRELAAEIRAHLNLSDLCEEPKVEGPGFINLRLRDDWLESHSNQLVADARLGHVPTQLPRKMILDYSSPNVAKPMHVGHLRSSVIGDALYRILTFVGHTVVGDNHVGDWGTQFGMIIYGYKHFLDLQAFDEAPVAELARLYRLVNQLAGYQGSLGKLPRLREELARRQSQLETGAAAATGKQAKKALRKAREELQSVRDQIAEQERIRDAVAGTPELKTLADAHPEIAEAARGETARLHAGDEENLRLWREFLPRCLEALSAVYDRLGIRFDLTLGESFYQPMLAEVVDDLVARGIAVESEGAICVFIEGNPAPFIVRKRDGAFTYATSDLATIRYRHKELNADSMLYVVDARQSEHFNLLFETARRWGYDRTEFQHISFGTILGEDKRPFKTRSGDTVGLESLLDEAVARARRIVDENDEAKPNGPELDEATRAAVAEAVGIGGIKYADLRHNRDSDYVFSWDKMLATTGDTATYMQYAYARISGIFRKGQIDRDALRAAGGRIRFARPEERTLALQLSGFAEAVDGAGREYRPNFLTQYLFDTANAFSTFYRECPVLAEENEELRTSRLLLCDVTARVISNGLALLGIPTCEQM